MRRKLLILAAVAMLSLVLAIPASASKAVEVSGKWLLPPLEFWDDEVPIGNTCHVTGFGKYTYVGDIAGVGTGQFHTVAHGGPCPGGPGTLPESYHEEGRFEVTVLGREGVFVRTCHALWRPPLDEENFTLDCTIVGTEGELVGLHGHMTENIWTEEYTGLVHFDPDR